MYWECVTELRLTELLYSYLVPPTLVSTTLVQQTSIRTKTVNNHPSQWESLTVKAYTFTSIVFIDGVPTTNTSHLFDYLFSTNLTRSVVLTRSSL